MKYTLGKAARATGKSKTTLHRAITSGKLSAIRNTDGEYEIDPAELMRVFEIVTPEPQKRHDMERSVTVDETPVLRAEIEGLKQQLALLKDERDDLRRRLDEDSAERRRLTLLLTTAHYADTEAVSLETPVRWLRSHSIGRHAPLCRHSSLRLRPTHPLHSTP